MIPEPTYSGPENVLYFRSLATLEESLKENKQHTVWLVCFYTVWNPVCANFAPIFAQLSVEYVLNSINKHYCILAMYSFFLF